MDNLKISVIVPIYNMEQLMRKCLDSILAQTFREYECLLIDDGSTDSSSAICDEYAAKDSRFKAFHKPNGGLSDARNYGLAKSIGEYTIFFDPDDWVDADCLKDLYAKAQDVDADMVMCDVYYNDKYSQRYSKMEPTALDNYSVIQDLLNNKIHGFTWNKLLRRKLYNDYKISYPKGIYGCEDLYTMCELLKNDIKIAYLPKAYYHYMFYSNTTQSRKYDENTYLVDVQIRDMFVSLLKSTPFADLVNETMTMRIFEHAFFAGYNEYTSKQFKQYFNDYLPLIQRNHSRFRIFYVLSSKGFYRPCRWLLQCGFNIKQIIKKIKA